MYTKEVAYESCVLIFVQIFIDINRMNEYPRVYVLDHGYKVQHARRRV